MLKLTNKKLSTTDELTDPNYRKASLLKRRCYKRQTLQKTNSTKEQLYKRPTPTQGLPIQNIN